MRVVKTTAAFAIGSLLFFACGTDEAPQLEPPPGAPAPTEATIQTADSDHGTILADADGLTLYVFLNDTEGESTCFDACAETWPPLVVGADPVAAPGVDGSLGIAERPDGSQQVTIEGSPLYRYSGDTQPGDTNGQGIGDVWYVVAPDGSEVRE